MGFCPEQHKLALHRVFVLQAHVVTVVFSERFPLSNHRSVHPTSHPSTDELLQEISRLEELLRQARRTLDPVSLPEQSGGALSLNEGKIRRVLAARRIRDRQLGEDLFCDPAWDLLLQAFAAQLGQTNVSASDLVQASNVPGSVALRWIRKLEQDGWLSRRSTPDGEILELTLEGSIRLRRFFEMVAPGLLI